MHRLQFSVIACIRAVIPLRSWSWFTRASLAIRPARHHP